MKTFEERRAEIFRRSEERIKKRKKIMYSCIETVVCACSTLLLLLIIPDINASQKDIINTDRNAANNAILTPEVNEIIDNEPVLKISGKNITGYGGATGVRIVGENGDLQFPWEIEPQNLNEGLHLSVVTSANFLTTAKFINVAVDVYVFCDGHIIKHSETVDDEPVEVTRHSVGSSGAQYTIPVYIPPTSIGNVDETLLWVCVNYIPEYVPTDWMGEVDNMFMDYVPVCSSGIESVDYVYEAQLSDYFNDKRPLTSDGESLITPYVDIGAYHENTNSTTESIYYELADIKTDTDFSIAAYFEDDFDYYLAVFCNGELTDIFDGSLFMKVNCNGGKRMVKYSIDKSMLPEDGVYAYQVIALPTKVDDSFTKFHIQSKKHRITISLDE